MVVEGADSLVCFRVSIIQRTREKEVKVLLYKEESQEMLARRPQESLASEVSSLRWRGTPSCDTDPGLL